jgi:enoyl-CoA hydratase/carnithine racemase
MQHGPSEHIAASTSGHVATIEIRRGPNNFVDTDMVAEIADALEHYDRTPDVRAIVLCAEGKHFCAGADFASRVPDGVARGAKSGRHLYKEAQRLWRTGKPIVVAVHGAAVGAGIGLAVMADFRVACPEARFSANFTRLGFHPGLSPARPSANTKNRTGCATLPTSRRAPRQWPNAACPTSRRADKTSPHLSRTLLG